jgi:hypothetical protein
VVLIRLGIGKSGVNIRMMCWGGVIVGLVCIALRDVQFYGMRICGVWAGLIVAQGWLAVVFAVFNVRACISMRYNPLWVYFNGGGNFDGGGTSMGLHPSLGYATPSGLDCLIS